MLPPSASPRWYQIHAIAQHSMAKHSTQKSSSNTDQGKQKYLDSFQDVGQRCCIGRADPSDCACADTARCLVHCWCGPELLAQPVWEDGNCYNRLRCCSGMTLCKRRQAWLPTCSITVLAKPLHFHERHARCWKKDFFSGILITCINAVAREASYASHCSHLVHATIGNA